MLVIHTVIAMQSQAVVVGIVLYLGVKYLLYLTKHVATFYCVSE